MEQLPAQVAHDGFSAIVIDRNGYEDNGAAIAADIRGTVSAADVIAETDRYIAFDIRALAGTMDAGAARLPVGPVLATASMPSCGAKPLMAIDQIGSNRAVVGPGGIRIKTGRALRVRGWTVDQEHEAPAAGVDVMVDEVSFTSLYGWDRPEPSAQRRSNV